MVRLGFQVSLGVGFVVGMSVLFIFIYDVVTQSDYFKIEEIEIRGGHRLSMEEICGQARIEKGMNMFSANRSRAKKRLAAHPWIAEAKIRLRPPHRIQITIREHTPLAFINLDRTYIMNAHGEIFKEKSHLDRFPLPVIQGLAFFDIYLPGKPRSYPFQAVMDVLSLGNHMDSVLPNRMIKEIHVDRDVGLTVIAFKSKTAILLGYGNYAGKYKRLKRVLFHLRKRMKYEGIRFIDLNNAERIVMAPTRAGTADEDKKEVSFAKTRRYYRRT
jgi:cell division protein FtsQ